MLSCTSIFLKCIFGDDDILGTIRMKSLVGQAISRISTHFHVIGIVIEVNPVGLREVGNRSFFGAEASSQKDDSERYCTKCRYIACFNWNSELSGPLLGSVRGRLVIVSRGSRAVFVANRWACNTMSWSRGYFRWDLKQVRGFARW
jgi:hypothetical protein